jgi:hypothetical protein
MVQLNFAISLPNLQFFIECYYCRSSFSYFLVMATEIAISIAKGCDLDCQGLLPTKGKFSLCHSGSEARHVPSPGRTNGIFFG